jgi:nitrite reductase/ring-hydroxylating ferredoxin subunit
MKSAYGRQTPAPDYELTCVEPGSPMGELMRRYWQPVCTSDELRDLSRKEKLLCEEVVVFRDKKGRVGALDPHCAHRGTSLEWGRVEEEGLRCCYHGWLYDTQGQCIDMPCETGEPQRTECQEADPSQGLPHRLFWRHPRHARTQPERQLRPSR